MKINIDKMIDLLIKIVTIAILFVGIAIVIMISRYQQARKCYEQIREQAKIVRDTSGECAPGVDVKDQKTVTDTENPHMEQPDTEQKNMERLNTEIDIRYLQTINKNAFAWISACDGAIDYPVVWAEDDAFYLSHDLYGDKSVSGTIFIRSDTTAPFAQFFTPLYGHNMKDGSMFHSLMSYKSADYFEQHPQFAVYVEREKLIYQVFAVVVAAEEELPVSVRDDKKEAFLEEVKKCSLYDCRTPVSSTDQLVALVTCEYSEANYRLAVYGVRVL